MNQRKRPGGQTGAREETVVVERQDLLAKTEPEQQEISPTKKTADEHAEIISAAYRKGVAALIETGKSLRVAKDDLAEHGQWLPLLETMLPFRPRVAQRLMQIARNAVLANTSYQTFLPPHIDTLVQRDKLANEFGDGALLARLKDGRITPATTTKDVSAMLRPQGQAQAPKAAKPSRDTKLRKELEATQEYVVELEAARPDTEELERLREENYALKREKAALASEVEELKAALAAARQPEEVGP